MARLTISKEKARRALGPTHFSRKMAKMASGKNTWGHGAPFPTRPLPRPKTGHRPELIGPVVLLLALFQFVCHASERNKLPPETTGRWENAFRRECCGCVCLRYGKSSSLCVETVRMRSDLIVSTSQLTIVCFSQLRKLSSK